MIDWQLIDEEAPKDRRVLLFFPTLPDWGRVQGGTRSAGLRWSADRDDLFDLHDRLSNLPTHWAEINEPEIGA